MIPLAIHPWPVTDEDRDRIIDAIARVFPPDFQYLPSPAAPGGPVRVLSLRVPAPWMCDQAVVADPARPGSLETALSIVMNPSRHDERLVTKLDFLRAILGPDVREIDVPQPEGVHFE